MNDLNDDSETITIVFNKIVKLIKENGIADVSLNEAKNDQLQAIGKKERKQLIKNTNEVDYKFAEYTIFNNKFNSFCIAIGFNPAKCDIDKYDKTNQKLCNYFSKKNLGGYILLNLYPIVSKNEDSFSCDNESKLFYDNILPKLIDCGKCKIYIFWGSSITVSKSIGKALKRNKKRIYFISDKEKHHHHPAYVKEDDICDIPYNKVTIEDKGIRYK